MERERERGHVSKKFSKRGSTFGPTRLCLPSTPSLSLARKRTGPKRASRRDDSVAKVCAPTPLGKPLGGGKTPAIYPGPTLDDP